MNAKQLWQIFRTLRRGVFEGLPMADAKRHPIDIFGEWFAVAERSGLYLPEAVTLATSTADGAPSARMVLLKGFDRSGFTFFTNYRSRKAKELDANHRAALVFHWSLLQRQVRIEGRVERTSVEESAEYFRTRPRGSQIAAWASRQSAPLNSRGDLEQSYRDKQALFGDGDVPLPDFWGGYRVEPNIVEFWQGRANRMHDRLCFRYRGDDWVSEWLCP